jgi:hypothetical protein
MHYVERAREAGGGMLATACLLSDSCKDDDHRGKKGDVVEFDELFILS